MTEPRRPSREAKPRPSRAREAAPVSPPGPPGNRPAPPRRGKADAEVARAPRPDRARREKRRGRREENREGKPDERSSAPPRDAPPPSPAGKEEPGARISRRAAERLRSGQVWVYASDLEEVATGGPDAPLLLPVADPRGLLLGTALYSPASQIVLRLVARAALDTAGWLRLLEARLRAAVRRRRSLLDAPTDACRLCFSEADELPGLVVDQYGPVVVVQRLTRGLGTPEVQEVCVRVLREETAAATIVERPDPRIRELEGLGAPDPAPWWAADPQAPVTRAAFHLHGLAFEFDANAGQKTGAFLDQRLNYAAAREWAERLGRCDRALDVCCYQGGFALHLGAVCRAVTGIDTSRASLEVAERNLEANRARIAGSVDWVEGDAFRVLRDWSDGGETFDAIVLDPPAFARTKRAVEGALRGYKELNLRALKMARPGALLLTCSCSHHVGWADLEGAVRAAAADAGRRVRLLERRGASPDHPVVLNLPETEYLKCLILEVD